MAYSRCPQCENTAFEVVENSPSKSRFKLLFVQCGKCGSVIGTMDFFNVGSMIETVESKIEKLERSLSTIDSINNSLNMINQNVDTLHRLMLSTISKKE